MKHQQIHDKKVARDVLGLSETQLADFIMNCVKERSLSAIMSTLNNDVLYGTRPERERAELALERLGFACA